jgi:predicted phosphodiesterase
MSLSSSIAILSDVHGNLVALRTVLAELADLGVRDLAVAGDLVGFGPNPDDVVDLLVEREARLIRGNHEKDYVAPYATLNRGRIDPRFRSMIWSMERLGPERRAFLAALPDALYLDADTLVVHGSPRHVRDAVLAWTPEAELEAMYTDTDAHLVFMGHTHRPIIRDTARRRLVNAGSVGMPLDGDPRASYVLIQRNQNGPTGWQVEIRRVLYDVEAAIAAFDNGLRDADAGYVELMSRQLRAARDYYGPWLRRSHALPEAELGEALREYLGGGS